MKFYCKNFVMLCMLIAVCPVHADPVVLCKKNEYVSKCSGYKLGTNWLRGTINEQPYDFYNYNYNNHQSNTNMQNLYVFFKDYTTLSDEDDHHGHVFPKVFLLEYYKQDGKYICTPEVSGSGGNCLPNYMSCSPDATCENTYYDKAKALLNTFCNIRKGGIVECEPCPNGYTFDKSVAYYYSSGDTNAVSQWSINTIADCYRDTFVDETGTYESLYIGSSGEKYPCFYGDEVLGDKLPAITH